METKNIHLKLHNIQHQLVAPKDQVNKFGNYAYRTCEGILEALKPLLCPDLTIVMSDELVNLGDRYYIKATVTLTDMESGESISATGYAREEEEKKGMDQSQITGASSSYARKYALCGLLAIDGNKDSDETCEKTKDDNPKPQQQKTQQQQKPQQVKPNPQPQPVPAQRRQRVLEYLQKLDDITLSSFKQSFMFNSLSDISDDTINAIANYLNAQKK